MSDTKSSMFVVMSNLLDFDTNEAYVLQTSEGPQKPSLRILTTREPGDLLNSRKLGSR